MRHLYIRQSSCNPKKDSNGYTANMPKKAQKKERDYIFDGTIELWNCPTLEASHFESFCSVRYAFPFTRSLKHFNR